jgi:hypothetical protein
MEPPVPPYLDTGQTALLRQVVQRRPGYLQVGRQFANGQYGIMGVRHLAISPKSASFFQAVAAIIRYSQLVSSGSETRRGSV